MKKFNPQVEEYIAKSADFAKLILKHLQQLIHETCPDVVDAIKWGIPHFDYKGEMMCILAAYKNHCSFTFWKADLMTDKRLKENSKLKADKRFMGKLKTLEDLPKDKELIAFIKEAMLLNAKGGKLIIPKSDKPKVIETPDYFLKELAKNPKAKAVFESKSSSFRKEYAKWLIDAKTEDTKEKRTEQALEWIAEGKGRFWQYTK
jgi:uncharacterized protein YdeI (YjbR/CyaY-like superfamily)